jgi:hypothetical protein
VEPSQADPIPQSLLVHDGELEDLRLVLDGIGTPFCERRGALGEADANRPWDLIVSTPSRMLELELPDSSKPIRIVIVDQDSKTLRARLHGAGIKLMVRRPVHPAALRGLILHAVYRGPEKRRSRRVTVGAPIRIRSQWRQSPGILADLSLGGCRLISNQPVKEGRTFKLVVPAEVAGSGKAYRLRARAIRSSGIESDETPGTHSIQARFEPPSQRQLKLLKETIIAYQGGPAMLAGSEALLDAAARHEAAPAAAAMPLRVESDHNAREERREQTRQEIEKRVVALDQEADRVLMGRDLSPGGMRVSPSPHLRTGGDVKIAIHLNDAAPLTLRARVHRDDGERGVVLRFHELPPEASAAFMSLMETTPVVAPGEEDDGGLIVSELLEVESA